MALDDLRRWRLLASVRGSRWDAALSTVLALVKSGGDVPATGKVVRAHATYRPVMRQPIAVNLGSVACAIALPVAGTDDNRSAHAVPGWGPRVDGPL